MYCILFLKHEHVTVYGVYYYYAVSRTLPKCNCICRPILITSVISDLWYALKY